MLKQRDSLRLVPNTSRLKLCGNALCRQARPHKRANLVKGQRQRASCGLDLMFCLHFTFEEEAQET